MTLNRRSLLTISAAGLAFGATPEAMAQGGVARILAGFPAGGTVDATARRLAEAWRGRLAEAVIVENRVGAAGRLAAAALKDAAPDGMTLLVTPDFVLTIYSSVYAKLDYDPAVDLAPVSPVSAFTFAFGVGPGVPESVRTLPDFAAWSKASPQPVGYGSPAAGSMPHFLGDQFVRAAGLPAKHVPYRGSAPALQDLVGGHVPAVVTVLGEFLPFLDGGRIRMLGVTDRSRSRFMPNVPTFAEQGFAEVIGVETYGVFLPGRAPPALVERLNGLVRDAVLTPAVADGLARIGMEPLVTSPGEYRDRLAREREVWAPIVKASGFRLTD